MSATLLTSERVSSFACPVGNIGAISSTRPRGRAAHAKGFVLSVHFGRSAEPSSGRWSSSPGGGPHPAVALERNPSGLAGRLGLDEGTTTGLP